MFHPYKLFIICSNLELQPTTMLDKIILITINIGSEIFIYTNY